MYVLQRMLSIYIIYTCIQYIVISQYVTVYRKAGHNAACVNREKIDRFLKNVLFQADGRERLGLL